MGFASAVRRMLPLLLAIIPLFAYSFDSERWLEKRSVMTADAARLRAEYSNSVKRVSSPSEGIAIPLETYPDGRIRTLVSATKAQFFADNSLVWAEDLRFVKMKADGSEELRLDASSCLIDRVSRSGWVEGHAKVVQDKTLFEGDNVYFSSSNSFVTAYMSSDLKSSDLKYGGLRPDERSDTNKTSAVSARIRAKRTDMDRSEGVIMFEDDVFVEYSSDYTLNSARLFAFLKGTNSISRIVASGGVTVTNESRVGECDMAVFREHERRIDMYGGAGRPARLLETSGTRSEVVGSKVSFWIDTEQVEVVAPIISVEEKNVR